MLPDENQPSFTTPASKEQEPLAAEKMGRDDSGNTKAATQPAAPEEPTAALVSPPPRGRLGRTLRKAIFIALYVVAMIALLVGGLKLIDYRLGKSLPPTSWLDSESRRLTIRTLELFPYKGFHLQANVRYQGPMPWNDHTPEANFDVRTGDKGFFVDFELENPPPKEPNEFRIILIGGSGAQGWGATRNETMFYSVLERTLNQRLASRGLRVRVINLAMGTTFAYQNYVSLNLWGHQLEPDLILAYIGRNEFWVPLWHESGSDVYTFFHELDSFSMANRGSEYPPKMAWLMELMPNLMRRTSIGLGLKIAFGWDYFQQRGYESYLRSRGLRIIGRKPQQVLDDYATPRLIHSMKSIKRDFDGVPIMVAWQAVREELEYLSRDLPPDFYDKMYDRTQRELRNFMNDQWHYINIHHIGRTMSQGRFQCHLDDTAHAIVGNIFADQIERLIPGMIALRDRRQAQGLASYGK